MALKTNFTDDILAESMNGKRQYNVTENSNGTKSLEDVTDYQSVGSTFSAKDMNETNAAVNQAYDDMGDEFNKDTKYLAGSVKIHNNKLWKFKVDHDPGEWDESQVRKTTLLDEIGELTEKIPEPILLWENTNNLTFAAQTITLSSDDYDYMEVFYVTSNGTKIIEVSSCKVLKGLSFALKDVLTSSDYLGTARRSVTFVSDTELSVGNCARGDAVSTSSYQYKTDNKRIYPYKIYGGKF